MDDYGDRLTYEHRAINLIGELLGYTCALCASTH